MLVKTKEKTLDILKGASFPSREVQYTELLTSKDLFQSRKTLRTLMIQLTGYLSLLHDDAEGEDCSPFTWESPDDKYLQGLQEASESCKKAFILLRNQEEYLREMVQLQTQQYFDEQETRDDIDAHIERQKR